MVAISESLRQDLRQPEFSEGYAESFQDAYVATQIKVLREQNKWTQADLAKELGTTQTVISRIENVNYSAWNISTLKKLARAFRVRLKVSFETYGSLVHDVENFSREGLQRLPRERDPELYGPVSEEAADLAKLVEHERTKAVIDQLEVTRERITLRDLATGNVPASRFIRQHRRTYNLIELPKRRSEGQKVREYGRRKPPTTSATA